MEEVRERGQVAVKYEENTEGAVREPSSGEHSSSHHRRHRGRYHRYHGDKKKARRRKMTVAALIVLSALAVIASAAALLLKEPVLRSDRPDFLLEQLEDMEDTLYVHQTEWGPVHYSRRIEMDLSDKSIGLYFLNPADSGQEVSLQLCIGNEPILQTGKLQPGEDVTELEVLYRQERRLSPGGYEGKFIVIAQELESGELNKENAEIPIVIRVTEE